MGQALSRSEGGDQPANPLQNFFNMAQPLINNVINQNNMDTPINEIVPDGGEVVETESLFMQLTS